MVPSPDKDGEHVPWRCTPARGAVTIPWRFRSRVRVGVHWAGGAWAGGCEAPHSVPDDDTLVLTVNEHVAVHVVREGIDVWGILVLSLVEEVRS